MIERVAGQHVQRSLTVAPVSDIVWPWFSDTVGVWARCAHCVFTVWKSTLQETGAVLTWHLYDEHPERWATQYGADRKPVETRHDDGAGGVWTEKMIMGESRE